MLTYEFQHQVENCNHEWELELSIKAPDPTHCPKCNKEGNIVRLISGGSGKGIVELSGHELDQKIKEDTRKFKKEVYSNEYQYASIIGENRYQEIQTSLDRRKR